MSGSEKYLIFPSLNNPIVFKDLKLLVDTLPGQTIGVWELSTGKCLQIIKNLFKNSQMI